MNRDEYYMRMALSLAKKGYGQTNPNPMVGAVLVKNGKILAKGYHKRWGLPHAEIEALRRAGSKAKGATLYINLEPCNHFGKTPPCTDRIIKEGIKRVVIGMRDPNPINNGKGIERLQRNGIKVKCNILKEDAALLNRVFTTYITKKRPYVMIKIAQSLDGKIATYAGYSKWITNDSSRRFVHKLRKEVDAILVGINTIIKDDSLLTSRLGNLKKQPTRIILDTKLRIPKESRAVKDKASKTIIATTKNMSKKSAFEFRKRGIDVATFGKNRGMVDLMSLLKYLARNNISHLLVEGGGTVISSFLNNRLVDEVLFFISPKIIGGRDAVTSVEGKGARFIKEAIKLKDVEIKRFDGDILIRGYVYRHN